MGYYDGLKIIVKPKEPIWSMLHALPEGVHPCGFNKGWLNVDIEKDGAFSLLWTSHKNKHHPYNGSAYGGAVYPYGMKCLCKSVLTMHPPKSEDEAIHIASVLEKRIVQAYQKNRK